jgi:hypothetical protein
MQRSTSSTHGGLFSKFGGSKTPTSTRPSTSSELPATHSESTYGSTTSRTSTFGRTTSFSSNSNSKSPKTPQRSRNNSGARIAVPNLSPEKRAHSATRYTDSNPLPVRVPSRQETDSLPKSADSSTQVAASAEAAPSRPASVADSFTSTTPYSNMLVRPGTSNLAMGYNGPMPVTAPLQPPSPTLENITYQHIQETSSKRISTLDYLRKAYDFPASLLCLNADGF